MFYCFFFQAEDGIRDGRVTGVQTCALPISREQQDDDDRRGHRGDHRPPAADRDTAGRRAGVGLGWGTTQIGRASCRERVEISGVAVSLKKKKKEDGWKATSSRLDATTTKRS